MNTDATSLNSEASESASQIPCRYIRSKEMYHQAAGQPEDDCSSGIYWCSRTQECLGPDGHACGKTDCGPNRACYLA